MPPKQSKISLFLSFLIVLILFLLISFQVLILDSVRQFAPLLVFLATNEFTIVDQREVLGAVFSAQIPIDNSVSTTDLSIDLPAWREFSHTIVLSLNDDAELDSTIVEERILEAYDLLDRQGEKTCFIPADVPAGEAYRYEIEWTQMLHEGNIEEGSGNGNIIGTYSVIVDLQCQVVDVDVIQD
jgi:hypothetical protein